VGDWSFLTNHTRVLLRIAHDPGVWLRDIAAGVGVTERTAYGIITDLTEVRRQAQGRPPQPLPGPGHLPLPGTGSRERIIGEILAVLAGAGDEATA
jgi:hypothetical protein